MIELKLCCETGPAKVQVYTTPRTRHREQVCDFLKMLFSLILMLLLLLLSLANWYFHNTQKRAFPSRKSRTS